MVAAPTFSVSSDFNNELDRLLLGIAEALQLSVARHDLAVSRYQTLNKVLEGQGSPFQYLRPLIYAQGSMALGTTVSPISGEPHDLDFVLQLSQDHWSVDPMMLIRSLYQFLCQSGTYRDMTKLKNRCVRIEYADDFYMDVLPACLDLHGGGTCIRIPDCAARSWTDSNPKGFIDWFINKSKRLLVRRMMDKAEPIPERQPATNKRTLQLIVQLTKRWRDRYYAGPNYALAPISIVLTTLGADTYDGEPSVSRALFSMLNGIVRLIDDSRARGEEHIHLRNPSNPGEELTERWNSNPAAYQAFERGIREFQRDWSKVMDRQVNVRETLVRMFGEPAATVLRTGIKNIQTLRQAGSLGVASTGVITGLSGAVARIRPNTFYGEE